MKEGWGERNEEENSEALFRAGQESRHSLNKQVSVSGPWHLTAGCEMGERKM